VSLGIRGEGKVAYSIFVDIVIKLDEDTETSVCEDDMCRFGENVLNRLEES
jgi:hypothetical protein